MDICLEAPENLDMKMQVFSEVHYGGMELGEGEFTTLTLDEKVLVLTHGFISSAGMDVDWMQHAVQTIQKANRLGIGKRTTVILFNWSHVVSYQLNYNQTAANSQVAARALAKSMVVWKKYNPGLEIHLVGHSLGAHVMGQERAGNGLYLTREKYK